MVISQTLDHTLDKFISQFGPPANLADSTEITDPVEFLKAQHREVENLFDEIEELGENASQAKRTLFNTLADKLELHTELEEKCFYPNADEHEHDLIMESLEEHDAVKDLIAKIKRTKTTNDTFKARVTVLKEMVEHHVKEEEKELFPSFKSSAKKNEVEKICASMERLMIKKAESTQTKKSKKNGAKRKIRSRAKIHKVH